MKHLKSFNESVVDDKISILKDLSLDLTDDNYLVYIHKCGKNLNFNIPNFHYMNISRDFLYDSSKIMVVIKYKNYFEKSITMGDNFRGKLTEEEFNNSVDEYILNCTDAGIKLRSYSGGSYFRVIFFEKWVSSKKLI